MNTDHTQWVDHVQQSNGLVVVFRILCLVIIHLVFFGFLEVWVSIVSRSNVNRNPKLRKFRSSLVLNAATNPHSLWHCDFAWFPTFGLYQ